MTKHILKSIIFFTIISCGSLKTREKKMLKFFSNLFSIPYEQEKKYQSPTHIKDFSVNMRSKKLIKYYHQKSIIKKQLLLKGWMRENFLDVSNLLKDISHIICNYFAYDLTEDCKYIIKNFDHKKSLYEKKEIKNQECYQRILKKTTEDLLYPSKFLNFIKTYYVRKDLEALRKCLGAFFLLLVFEKEQELIRDICLVFYNSIECNDLKQWIDPIISKGEDIFIKDYNTSDLPNTLRQALCMQGGLHLNTNSILDFWAMLINLEYYVNDVQNPNNLPLNIRDFIFSVAKRNDKAKIMAKNSSDNQKIEKEGKEYRSKNLFSNLLFIDKYNLKNTRSYDTNMVSIEDQTINLDSVIEFMAQHNLTE